MENRIQCKFTRSLMNYDEIILLDKTKIAEIAFSGELSLSGRTVAYYSYKDAALNHYKDHKTLYHTVGTVGAVTAGTLIALPAAVSLLGFGAIGVAKGSIAAAAQSYFYGGATTGIFSTLQSAGVLGVSGATKAICIAGANAAIYGNDLLPSSDPDPIPSLPDGDFQPDGDSGNPSTGIFETVQNAGLLASNKVASLLTSTSEVLRNSYSSDVLTSDENKSERTSSILLPDENKREEASIIFLLLQGSGEYASNKAVSLLKSTAVALGISNTTKSCATSEVK